MRKIKHLVAQLCNSQITAYRGLTFHGKIKYRWAPNMLTWKHYGFSRDQSWVLKELCVGTQCHRTWGLPGQMLFWGRSGYLCGKWLDVDCRHLTWSPFLSSAMCAGKIVGFIASLVSLQTLHETNVYLQG